MSSGAQDAPEEHSMLVSGRNSKIAEDQNEDEDVVDRKRLLNEVPREVLQARFTTHEAVDGSAKHQCERNPDDAPYRRFLDADLVRFLVNNEEVEGEHREDTCIEDNPQP
jgi:hypothetical protein